jgi:probable rRNA maturation factor
MKKNINIDVEFDNPDIESKKLEQLITGICLKFKQSSYSINIQIVGDDEIHRANKQFLSHDCPTDVISFDLSDNDEKCFDIIVNYQLAQRKAKELGHSVMAELALYITHGLLHNLGFNDLNEADAKKMHQKEDEILQDFGYGIVYNSK